jgi:hypothetical protein
MKRQSDLVQKWLPEQGWSRLIPPELKDPIKQLAAAGNIVIRAGLENPKAPSLYFFVSGPFDPDALIEKSLHPELLFKLPDGSGIGCMNYASICFDPTVEAENS